MNRVVATVCVLLALVATVFAAGCGRSGDSAGPLAGPSTQTPTGAKGTPKQGNANAAAEGAVAAPSGLQTGNYAGGRK